MLNGTALAWDGDRAARALRAASALQLLASDRCLKVRVVRFLSRGR